MIVAKDVYSYILNVNISSGKNVLFILEKDSIFLGRPTVVVNLHGCGCFWYRPNPEGTHNPGMWPELPDQGQESDFCFAGQCPANWATWVRVEDASLEPRDSVARWHFDLRLLTSKTVRECIACGHLLQ